MDDRAEAGLELLAGGQRKSSHTVSVEGAPAAPTGTAGRLPPLACFGTATWLSLLLPLSPADDAQTAMPPAIASTTTTDPATMPCRRRRARVFSFSRCSWSRSRAVLLPSWFFWLTPLDNEAEG